MARVIDVSINGTPTAAGDIFQQSKGGMKAELLLTGCSHLRQLPNVTARS